MVYIQNPGHGVHRRNLSRKQLDIMVMGAFPSRLPNDMIKKSKHIGKGQLILM